MGRNSRDRKGRRTGICRSISTRSNFSCSAISTAIFPSKAVLICVYPNLQSSRSRRGTTSVSSPVLLSLPAQKELAVRLTSRGSSSRRYS